jgi:hypothetical protein
MLLQSSTSIADAYFVGFDTRQPGGLLRTIAAQATDVAALMCEAHAVAATA